METSAVNLIKRYLKDNSPSMFDTKGYPDLSIFKHEEISAGLMFTLIEHGREEKRIYKLPFWNIKNACDVRSCLEIEIMEGMLATQLIRIW